MKKIICLLVLLLCLTTVVEAAQTKVVAESDYQWTGLAISRENRMFVCYPTWRNYPEYKVAEIKDGKAIAYPNKKLAASFSCVQSVYVDDQDKLWILDTGKPRGKQAVAGSAKLYKVDLRQNKLVWQYAFPASVDLATSYLNDVRVDTKRAYAYLTDSTQGGIIVLSMNAKEPIAYRALDNIPQVKADLPGIAFVSTGFDNHQTQSDGIELSKDGKILYFSALTGKTLYQIATVKLREAMISKTNVAGSIKIANANNVPTDGLWLKGESLYMGDLAKEGIYVFNLKTKQGSDLQLNQGIHWADSFAQDREGRLYFTTSQINYRNNVNQSYRIYQLEP
jgi:sugar lactone lactonase YvrE